MILIDFRNWMLNNKLNLLPNAQKQLLQRDFEELIKTNNFDILDLGEIKPLKMASLFFKNKNLIAVSAVKNITSFYEIIDQVLEYENKETIDYTEAAEEEVYFYGQNSLVTHLNSEIALCGVNEFSDESLFEEYCEDFELNPVSFDLPDDLLTSDMSFFCGDTLLICLEYIIDKKVKKQLFSLLKNAGIKIITITKEQVVDGILNMKYIDEKLIISKKAYNLFTDEQKENLPNCKVLEIPFLDRVEVKLSDIIF